MEKELLTKIKESVAFWETHPEVDKDLILGYIKDITNYLEEPKPDTKIIGKTDTGRDILLNTLDTISDKLPEECPQAWKDKYEALKKAWDEKDRLEKLRERLRELKLIDDIDAGVEMPVGEFLNPTAFMMLWNWILSHAKELGELV